MSFLELLEHPNRSLLMQTALTYIKGKGDGEELLQDNPELIRKAKERAKALSKQ